MNWDTLCSTYLLSSFWCPKLLTKTLTTTSLRIYLIQSAPIVVINVVSAGNVSKSAEHDIDTTKQKASQKGFIVSSGVTATTPSEDQILALKTDQGYLGWQFTDFNVLHCVFDAPEAFFSFHWCCNNPNQRQLFILLIFGGFPPAVCHTKVQFG